MKFDNIVLENTHLDGPECVRAANQKLNSLNDRGINLGNKFQHVTVWDDDALAMLVQPSDLSVTTAAKFLQNLE